MKLTQSGADLFTWMARCSAISLIRSSCRSARFLTLRRRRRIYHRAAESRARCADWAGRWKRCCWSPSATGGTAGAHRGRQSVEPVVGHRTELRLQRYGNAARKCGRRVAPGQSLLERSVIRLHRCWIANTSAPLGLLGRHGMLLLEKPPIVPSEETHLRHVVEQSVGEVCRFAHWLWLLGFPASASSVNCDFKATTISQNFIPPHPIIRRVGT